MCAIKQVYVRYSLAVVTWAVSQKCVDVVKAFARLATSVLLMAFTYCEPDPLPFGLTSRALVSDECEQSSLFIFAVSAISVNAN